MRKITKEEFESYVTEKGEFEKEHRKGCTFFCWCSYTLTQKDVEQFATHNIDASEFLNVKVVLSGYWDEYNGVEWGGSQYFRTEEYEELVPEQVIPAHTIVKTKETKFTPEW